MRNFALATALLASTATLALATSTTEPMFRTKADPTEIRVSDFIGMRVYSTDSHNRADSYDGVQDTWNDVGEINDVILSHDGRVESVLVDIGGFLGIDERQVAMNMSAISFVADNATADDPNDYFLVIAADRATTEDARGYSWATDRAGSVTTVNTPSTLARDGYVPLMPEYLTTETLTGAPVYDGNDAWIGEVSLLLDGGTTINKAVVDVGGFLGLGEKPVALDVSELEVVRRADGGDVRVYVGLTREQLEALPTFEK